MPKAQFLTDTYESRLRLQHHPTCRVVTSRALDPNQMKGSVGSMTKESREDSNCTSKHGKLKGAANAERTCRSCGTRPRIASPAKPQRLKRSTSGHPRTPPKPKHQDERGRERAQGGRRDETQVYSEERLSVSLKNLSAPQSALVSGRGDGF